jgi:hypothetical protein
VALGEGKSASLSRHLQNDSKNQSVFPSPQGEYHTVGSSWTVHLGTGSRTGTITKQARYALQSATHTHTQSLANTGTASSLDGH